MPKKLYLLAAFPLCLVPLAAQVAPSAEGNRTGIGLWIGAEFSTFNPDYGCANSSPFSCWNHQLIGVAPYLDTNYFLYDRIGAEGEVRLLLWHGPATLIESSYLAGPRVALFRSKDMSVAGKFLVGHASLDVPFRTDGGGFFAYATGLAIDFRVARHLAARVEYEYQMWPGYPPFKSGKNGLGGLTPNGLSFGLSYAIPLHSE